MPTKNSKNKVRLNLELTEQVNKSLEELKDRTDSPSLTEVLRRSIALFDMITSVQENGGSIVLRYRDGREEVIRLL
jgi:hypothetical protein